MSYSKVDMDKFFAEIALQNAEFDAVRDLAEAYRKITLTPVVDNDYPSIRAVYESAIRTLQQKMKENGR